MAVLRIAFLSSAVLELFSALGVAMVAAYVGFTLLGTFEFGTWGRRLSLGEGMFVLLLAPAFFEPLRELSAVWHDRAAGEAALDALDRLARADVTLPGAPGEAARGSEAAAPARLRCRCMACISPMPARTRFFEDYGLRIAAGEHVALMGPSGSGKTALLCLIGGLVPARQGEIAIGGVPLTDRTVASLRAAHGLDGPEAARVRGLGAGERRAGARRREPPTGRGRDALRATGQGGPGPSRRGRWARAAADCRAARRCGSRWRGSPCIPRPICCWSTSRRRTSTPRPPSAWPTR